MHRRRADRQRSLCGKCDIVECAKCTGCLPSPARLTIWCACATWRLQFRRCKSRPKCVRQSLELELWHSQNTEVRSFDIVKNEKRKTKKKIRRKSIFQWPVRSMTTTLISLKKS